MRFHWYAGGVRLGKVSGELDYTWSWLEMTGALTLTSNLDFRILLCSNNQCEFKSFDKRCNVRQRMLAIFAPSIIRMLHQGANLVIDCQASAKFHFHCVNYNRRQGNDIKMTGIRPYPHSIEYPKTT